MEDCKSMSVISEVNVLFCVTVILDTFIVKYLYWVNVKRKSAEFVLECLIFQWYFWAFNYLYKKQNMIWIQIFPILDDF